MREPRRATAVCLKRLSKKRIVSGVLGSARLARRQVALLGSSQAEHSICAPFPDCALPPPRLSQSGGAPTPAGSVSQARRRHRGQRLPGSDCLRTFNPVSPSHVLTMTLVVRRHLARDAPGHWTFGLTTGVRPDTPVTVRGSRHLRHRVAFAIAGLAVLDVPHARRCVRLLPMVEVAQLKGYVLLYRSSREQPGRISVRIWGCSLDQRQHGRANGVRQNGPGFDESC
jgi:hypothetical protein